MTFSYNGTTYLCDMNTECNTIYIENCIGIMGEVEVTGTNGSSGSSDVGGWIDIPKPGYYPPAPARLHRVVLLSACQKTPISSLRLY